MDESSTMSSSSDPVYVLKGLQVPSEDYYGFQSAATEITDLFIMAAPFELPKQKQNKWMVKTLKKMGR